MATGIAKNGFYSVAKKYYEKWSLPWEKNVKLILFQTGFCDSSSFDNINY